MNEDVRVLREWLEGLPKEKKVLAMLKLDNIILQELESRKAS